MASLKDLIVTGPARFLDKLYGNLEGNATTANQWSTARTFTIGSKGWKVSGDNDVTWTHAEIGAIVSNAWDAGTTAGPKIKTTVNGVTGDAVAIPSASISASGIVTTGPQRFRGKKSLEYPIITSKDSRYLGIEYYHHNGSTMVGDHWYDVGDNTNITAGKYYWRQYSPNTTANTSTTGFHETFSLPGVTVGRTDSASYEIFTSKSYTTLDSRYVNVTGDTMTGDLKFTNKGLHFIPGDTNQYLWKVYGSTDGSYGFRLQYNGASSGNDNSLSLIADNQQGTEVNAFSMLQDGTIILTVNPQFKTTNYTSTPISLIDDGTNYGHTMLIGAGGTTYIGAGESASGLYSKLAVKSTEDLILGADSNIRFHTNADNATATSGITLNTSNQLYPQTTGTGSIGTSGSKWKEAYFSDVVTAGKGFTVDGTMSVYPSNSNELNFGGSNNSSTLYFGYRAIDSRPIPTKFVFGSSGGTANLQCNTVYLGSGTSSYISSSQYTGNSATATSASKLAINNSASLADCLQYIQTSSQTSGNDLPPNSSWWHVLKMNHGTGDTYYKRLLAFDFFSHKIKTNYAQGDGAIKEWRSVLDSETGVARAHYSTTTTGSAYILVTIKPTNGWMLNFTLRLYQSYVGTDIQISGYNYGSNYWYSPDAVVLGSTSSAAQTIYFGYTSASNLWVAVPASNYTGADVFGATNGYQQISDLSEAFTITRVSSLPGTTQSTLTRYRPWYRDETVSNATYATSAGSANSVAWGNVTGKPSTFTPESHTHSYLPLSGGTLSGRLTLNTSIADHGNPTAQCLVINSSAVPSGTTLTDKNAPGIGFHIGNNSWGSLILNGGNFKFINNDATGYMPVYASTFYGNLSGNATSATKATQDGSGNTITTTYLKLAGGTLTGSLNISHATTATMDHTSTNPRIVFSESGSQPVGLLYTDYDSYRGPAGLKVTDMSGTNGNAWFEVQGKIYCEAIASGAWNGSAVGVGYGGTGATNKSNARINLGISSGTSLPSTGSAGDIFFLYA